jgi:hypothetical protein
MSRLYELVDEPELVSPMMIMALDGWIDAGAGAARATTAITEQIESRVVVSFDSDELLDHRSRRPIMHLVDGVNTGLTWPAIELREARTPGGHDLLLLFGAEPDHLWRAFSTDVVDLALQFGTSMVLGLGAYPAAVPHTLPTKLASTATDESLAQRIGFVRGTINVPGGIHAAIEERCAEVGLPAVGLWAQVPHYAAAMPYPAAAAALLDGIADLGGPALDRTEVRDEAEATRSRLDALVAESEEHQELVRQLERYAESEDEDGDAPMEMRTGEQIAAEFERFLREQDG